MYSVYQTKNISFKKRTKNKEYTFVSVKEKIDLAKNEFRLWTE